MENFLHGIEMKLKKNCHMKYGKIVFHFIIFYHALTAATSLANLTFKKRSFNCDRFLLTLIHK